MKYILGIVLALIAATVFFILRPQPDFEVGKDSAIPESAQVPAPATEQQDEQDEEAKRITARRLAMEAEFKKLEKARRNLESRLNRLKAVFWGEELPREQAEAINREMKNGYMLLKNKKLMGAYANAAQISHELSRIEFVDNYLREVEEQYRSGRLQ